ncbi:short-chain alcohol dehydrogenase-like protein [Apiospora phragmitis]|uniref:Short-chain alcohol dehydrogenase-like protein n=1 Tax=Apiospora phragmitis TaxID=2905665 RepID=A0ABR1W8J6_9PEZI
MAQLMEMMRVTLFGSRNDGKGASFFDPAKDIPSLAAKVVLVTGAAGDLGRTTAVQLARYGRPARIYAYETADDEEAKSENAGDDDNDNATARTEFRILDLDLGSLASVQACAAAFLAREERLDILVLNAGIIRVAPGTTADGYEAHFGINYLGHALLARLLAPTLVRTAEQSESADARVVVVSSEGHSSYAQRYGQSKIALIQLAKQLARRHPPLKAAAVHPGRILTGMAESLRKESLLVRITAPMAPLICVPVATGVKNHLWAATSADVVSGTYYEPVGVPDRESAVARDEGLAERLWEWTEKELVAAGVWPG